MTIRAAIATGETSSSVAQDVVFSVVDSRDGFAALKPEWDALFERCGRPAQLFQRHVLLSAWIESYLDDSQALAILTGRRGGRLVTVWPLVRRRRLALTSLTVMGDPVVQFADVLCEDDQRTLVTAQAWSAVASLGADLFHARKVRADSVLCDGLGLCDPVIFSVESAPYADLSRRVGSDGPGPAYSGKERSDHRRRLRRLAEVGPLDLKIFSPGREAEQLCVQAIAWKRQWLLREKLASAVVGCARFEAFFRACARDPQSGLRVAALYRGSRPIGIDLSFDCKQSSFGHVIAVDSDGERAGAGSVLVHQVFAAAQNRGAKVFEMLAPADEYKMRHADGSVGVTDVAVPFTSKGRAFAEFALKRGMPAAKALAKRLPPSLATFLARKL